MLFILLAALIQSAAPAVSPAERDLAIEVAGSAYTFGLCEEHMGETTRKQMLDAFRAYDPEASPGQEQAVRGMFGSLYLEGRADALRLQYDEAQCTRVIQAADAALRTARERVQSEASAPD